MSSTTDGYHPTGIEPYAFGELEQRATEYLKKRREDGWILSARMKFWREEDTRKLIERYLDVHTDQELRRRTSVEERYGAVVADHLVFAGITFDPAGLDVRHEMPEHVRRTLEYVRDLVADLTFVDPDYNPESDTFSPGFETLRDEYKRLIDSPCKRQLIEIEDDYVQSTSRRVYSLNTLSRLLAVDADLLPEILEHPRIILVSHFNAGKEWPGTGQMGLVKDILRDVRRTIAERVPDFEQVDTALERMLLMKTA